MSRPPRLFTFHHSLFHKKLSAKTGQTSRKMTFHNLILRHFKKENYPIISFDLEIIFPVSTSVVCFQLKASQYYESLKYKF